MSKLASRIADAEEHYRRGRLKQAAEAYDDVLAEEPDHLDALEWRGEIAVQLDDYETAVARLARARELRGDAEFGEYTNLGLSYYEMNQPVEAVETLWKAIETDPEDYVSHSNLGKALYDLHAYGEEEEARRLAADWMKRFPDVPDAQHIGAAISGLARPETANAAYVEDIFNDYAAIFDEKLVGELGYKAPQLLTARLRDWVRDRYGDDGAADCILDAGCGTGLCGPLLRPYTTRLEGVDLSPGMLEKAEEKACYDVLEKAELVSFLDGHGDRYDAVIAADVLCYIGGLEAVLDGAVAALRTGGWLGFSVERIVSSEGAGDGATSPDFSLDPSGRYKHDEGYIRKRMMRLPVRDVSISRDVLRTEYGEPVHGLIVTAVKSGA